MEVFTALCISVLSVLCVLWYWSSPIKVKYVFPPGPKGWPIIGSVLDVSPTHLHVSLAKIGKQYGDIFTINLMGTKAVVLNSVETIREALTEGTASDFAGRPFSFLGKFTDDDCSSVTFMSVGKIWQQLRKIVYKTINMYGDGVQKAENNIIEELRYVVDWLESNKDRDIDIEKLITPSLSNIMTYLLIGRRFDYGGPELEATVNMCYDICELGTPSTDAVLTRLPVLRHFPFGWGALYRHYMYWIQEYLKYYYHSQKEAYDRNINRGLIDVLFKTQAELDARGDNCPITDNHITSTMKDTIEAGTMTTRGSLVSFFLTILHHPDIARRIQIEIDREIGKDRWPSLKDRPNMPYTEATILEIVFPNFWAVVESYMTERAQ